MLRMTFEVRGAHMGDKGPVVATGQVLEYEANVRNVSPGILRIPAPDERLYVALTSPGTLSTRRVGGQVRHVATLGVGEELKFSGRFTLLQTNVCKVTVSFHNSQTQQVRRILVDDGKPVGKFRGMVSTTVMVPITNVWTGQISLSTRLKKAGRLDDVLRTRYRIAMRKVLAFEQAAQSMTNYSPAASGKLRLHHQNITQQNEAVSAIRQIGSDANSESVTWLWECFGKTQKNSPLHVAAMGELYQLLGQGIGSEHAERFLNVAKAHSTEEAIVTRLYAMDAAALYCTRPYFVCKAKGNYFITPVAPGLPAKVRETLKALTTDRLRDIHTRAKRLLGIPVPVKSRGTRKYIKSAGEKPWTPDDNPPK